MRRKIVFGLALGWMTLVAGGVNAEIVVGPGQDLIALANAAPPGETLTVTRGTYDGGTITNRVTIRFAEATGQAKFRSGVRVQADGVTLEGLTWSDMNDQLLEIRASNVTVRRCQFRLFGLADGASAKAIWIREDAAYQNTLIEDSLFEDWGNATEHTSCIKVSQVGGAQHSGTIIRNNIFRDGVVGGNNVAVQLFAPTLVEGNEIYFVEDGIEVKGSGSTIRGNHLHHNAGYEQLSNRSGSNNVFENNIVHDTEGPMAWVAEGENIIYRNNLFYGNADGMRLTGLVPNTYAQIRNVQIVNNVFYDNARQLTTDSRQTEPPQLVSLLNNSFTYGSLEISTDIVDLSDYNSYFQTTAAEPGAHDVVGLDPQFLDPENGDFRLQPDSPLIDRGIALSTQALDHQGLPRDPQWDIGAFEFQRVARNRLDLNGDALVNQRDLQIACLSGMTTTIREILPVVGSLPGDANGDGAVDFSDFVRLATNFQTSDAVYSDGDFSCDQQVQFADFVVLAKYFGNTWAESQTRIDVVRQAARESATSAQAVPEPHLGWWCLCVPLATATGNRQRAE